MTMFLNTKTKHSFCKECLNLALTKESLGAVIMVIRLCQVSDDPI